MCVWVFACVWRVREHMRKTTKYGCDGVGWVGRIDIDGWEGEEGYELRWET